MPCNASSKLRFACHTSVSLPKYGANASPARVTRYASITSREVDDRMDEREEAYVFEVTITRVGKARGVKVEKYIGKWSCGSSAANSEKGSGLYVPIGSWYKSSLYIQIISPYTRSH